MKNLFRIALLTLLPVALMSQVRNTATQKISLEIRATALLEVSGNPQPMRITAGEPGIASLVPVEDRSTSYKLTTNASDMKLSIAIDEPVPAGTRLFVEMEAAAGTSNGKIDISNAVSPVDAVTGIGRGSDNEQSIAYSFEADAGSPTFSPQSRTITLTLTN